MSTYESDNWINGEQPLGSGIALVRKNVSLLGLKREDYKHELIVHFVCEDVNDEGFPSTDEELEMLGRMEEVVANHFCERYGAKFAMCVTSDGVRDQFLYLPVPLSEVEIANDLEGLSLTVDYDFGIRESSDWSFYMNALSGAESPIQSTRLPWWKKLFGAR